MSNASYALNCDMFAGARARRENVKVGPWGLPAGVRKEARKAVHRLDRYCGKAMVAKELQVLAQGEVLLANDDMAVPLENWQAYCTGTHPASLEDLADLLFPELADDDADEAVVDHDLEEVMGCAVDVSVTNGWYAMAQLSLEADARSKRTRKAFQAHRDDDGEEMDY